MCTGRKRSSLCARDVKKHGAFAMREDVFSAGHAFMLSQDMAEIAAEAESDSSGASGTVQKSARSDAIVGRARALRGAGSDGAFVGACTAASTTAAEATLTLRLLALTPLTLPLPSPLLRFTAFTAAFTAVLAAVVAGRKNRLVIKNTVWKAAPAKRRKRKQSTITRPEH
jgi:hypothetical protein